MLLTANRRPGFWFRRSFSLSRSWAPGCRAPSVASVNHGLAYFIGSEIRPKRVFVKLLLMMKILLFTSIGLRAVTRSVYPATATRWGISAGDVVHEGGVFRQLPCSGPFGSDRDVCPLPHRRVLSDGIWLIGVVTFSHSFVFLRNGQLGTVSGGRPGWGCGFRTRDPSALPPSCPPHPSLRRRSPSWPAPAGTCRRGGRTLGHTCS